MPHVLDIEFVIDKLTQRFAQPLPEYHVRRVVFWYDVERDFEDKLDAVVIPNVTLVKLTGRNLFAVKKQICYDCPTENFLVYCPIVYQYKELNWLLNVELYSGSPFRADLISLWMTEMKLPSNPAMTQAVKEYKKFFNAKDRRNAFLKRNKGIESIQRLKMTILAALCDCEVRAVDVFQSVLSSGLSMENNLLFNSLKEYSLDDFFWEMVGDSFGYLAQEEPTLKGLMTHILLTAVHKTLSVELLPGHSTDSLTDFQKSNCCDFISHWRNSSNNQLKKSYIEITTEIEDHFSLPVILSRLPLEQLSQIDMFPCIEECILRNVMTSIAESAIRENDIFDIVERRCLKVLDENYKHFYEALQCVANMQRFITQHASGFQIAEPETLWKNYQTDYYRMDSYYRQYHLYFSEIEQHSNEYLDDAFKKVTEQVEGLYLQRFLKPLCKSWSNASSPQLAELGHVENIPYQQNFYRDKLRNVDSRTFVIISDGFRYELGMELVQKLKQETKCQVSIECVESVFPSATPYGMAALLPHQSLELKVRSDGKGVEVFADGLPTDSANRAAVLQKANPKSCVIQSKDFVAFNRTQRRAEVDGKDIVYIYHDKVDKTGHSSPSDVCSVCSSAIDEIKNLITIITNDLSGRQIYITADHGFLYTYKQIPESSKVDKTTPDDTDIEVDRRYLITRCEARPQYLLPVRLLGSQSNLQGYAPHEDVRIVKKGGSMNYVHGGVSLQELAIPLIDYHFLRNDSKTVRQNRDKYNTHPVELQLVSTSRKVCNRIFSLTFLQTEKISDNRTVGNYKIYFTNAEGRTISDVVVRQANKESENPTERQIQCRFNLNQVQFSKSETYYLVLEEESGVVPKQSIPFQIDIAFTMEGFSLFE